MVLHNLLFGIIYAEMAMILLLVFKTRLQESLILTLDILKSRCRVIKWVVAMALAIMLYYIQSIWYIQSLPIDTLHLNDRLLLATCTLKISLTGFAVFLLLIIDRHHHYIRELFFLRKRMETTVKNIGVIEDLLNDSPKQVPEVIAMIAQLESDPYLTNLSNEILKLKTKITILESDCHANKEFCKLKTKVECQTKENEITKTATVKSEFQKELEKFETNIAAMELAWKAKDTEMKELKTKIVTLEYECQENAKEITKIATLELECQEKEQQLKELKAKIVTLENECQEKAKEMTKIATLELECQKKEEEMKELQTKIVTLEYECLKKEKAVTDIAASTIKFIQDTNSYLGVLQA